MKSYTAFLDEAISARRLKELEAKGKADAAAQKMAADKLASEKTSSTKNMSNQKQLQGKATRQQQSSSNKELPTSALAIRKKPTSQKPVNRGGAIVKSSGNALAKTGKVTPNSGVADEKQAGKRPRDGRPLDTPNDRPDETEVLPDKEKKKDTKREALHTRNGKK